MAQLLDPEQWGRGADPGRSAGSEPDERPPGPRRTGAGSPPAAVSPDDSGWDPFAGEETGPASGPRRTPPPPSGPSGRSSRLPLILAIVLVLLALVAGGIWATASGLIPLGSPSGGDPTAAPETAAPPAETAPPEETEPPGEEPTGTTLPASCDELFSDSMRGTIEGAGLGLNPDWYVKAGDVRLPSEDAQLAELLGSLTRIDCAWVQPEGGGGVGMFTSVSQVTDEQAAEANARMEELGYTGIEELGGIRYVTETTAEGNTLGESHLIRDGLWFGTLWLNYAPTGYTADMVAQVLG